MSEYGLERFRVRLRRLSEYGSVAYLVERQKHGKNRPNSPGTQSYFRRVCCRVPDPRSGKEKTHKHKQICGIVPGLGGCQNFVDVFFGVIPYGEEKHINKVAPQIPGQSRENFGLRVFLLYVWDAVDPGNCPKTGKSPKVVRGGRKRYFLTLLGPGSKGLPRVFCTTQTLFCTGATPVSHQCKRPLARGVQKTFCTLS